MSKISDYKKFVKRAVELGAEDSKIIEAGSIATAAWVRLKCQYGCGGYNSNLCCPPNTPTHEEMRKVIDCYKKALLINKKEVGSITETIVALEHEIFITGYYKAFGLGAGPCSLCKTCPEDGCNKPNQARPSLEGCGIDVYATARANGFQIEVVRDQESDQNYYGIVLIE
jgi:predicted metal-binding protein